VSQSAVKLYLAVTPVVYLFSRCFQYDHQVTFQYLQEFIGVMQLKYDRRLDFGIFTVSCLSVSSLICRHYVALRSLSFSSLISHKDMQPDYLCALF